MGLFKIFVLCLIMVHFSLAQDSPQDFLEAHNAARYEVGVCPLMWDETVESYAKNYAEERIKDCELKHSQGDYGENIAWSSAELSAYDAVKMWVDEKANYDYESNTCQPGKVCAHYTQVVWKDSNKLGCAKVKCDNERGTFIICNYDPPGNYEGEKPYYNPVMHAST